MRAFVFLSSALLVLSCDLQKPVAISGATMEGRVLFVDSSGADIPTPDYSTVAIQDVGTSTRLDSAGHFRFSGLFPGVYSVRVYEDWWGGFDTLIGDFELSLGETRKIPDIRIQMASYVEKRDTSLLKEISFTDEKGKLVKWPESYGISTMNIAGNHLTYVGNIDTLNIDLHLSYNIKVYHDRSAYTNYYYFPVPAEIQTIVVQNGITVYDSIAPKGYASIGPLSYSGNDTFEVLAGGVSIGKYILLDSSLIPTDNRIHIQTGASVSRPGRSFRGYFLSGTDTFNVSYGDIPSDN